MRLSHNLFKTRKEAPKDEVSTNAELLIRAGFIDKLMAGVYTFLPLGLKTLRRVEGIVREEMDAVGGREILMPALQPKANWEATGRWKTLDALFKFTGEQSKIEFALGPTHEEIVTPLAGRATLSYRDLPAYLYQIQTKFRDEPRAKSGLLRGREFVMKDLYSFHADEADLDAYYETVSASYDKIFARLGLGDRTYRTYASGGTFSKYSHEFQTVAEAGEDTIYICDVCRIAVNEEIIGEQNSCPSCGSKALRSEKAIEVGNIFKLKTKYSSAFNLKYRDQEGKEQDVMMGCYGIGPSRLVGTIAEVYHDERGLIWPEAVAPAQVHLVALGSEGSAGFEAAERVYKMLTKAGIETVYDDRVGVTAGEKFADADLIGLPWRVVASDRLSGTGSIETKRRNETSAAIIPETELVAAVKPSV